MRLYLVVLSTVMLSACVATTPQVGYRAVNTTPVTIDGAEFKLFLHLDGTRIEVHRTNIIVPPPSRVDILEKAHRAIVHVTGCAVKKNTLIGDQAIIKAELVC